jgi:hypothetical protein
MIEDITGPDGNTVKALTFTFGRWQEIRFHLTKSIDEQRTDQNISDTYYKEVWLSYDIFIPSNYYHRGSGEGVEAGNNKGFFYLWHGPYESSQTQTSTSLQWWPSSSYHHYKLGGIHLFQITYHHPMQAQVREAILIDFQKHLSPKTMVSG